MSIERVTANSARAVRAYPVAPAELLAAVRRAVERLPRWSVEVAAAAELRAVRTTRFFRFKDDVTVRVSDREGGSLGEISSASRVGRSDLGQNIRNLRELLAALDGEIGGPEPGDATRPTHR